MPDYYTAMLKQECEATIKALAIGDSAVIDCVFERLQLAVTEAQLYRGDQWTND